MGILMAASKYPSTCGARGILHLHIPTKSYLSVVWVVAQTTIMKSRFLSILMKLALEGELRVPSFDVIVMGSFLIEG
jgi:hypothetical protein